MMSPSFGDGRNGLEYADDMFNSISKGSAYEIVLGEAAKADKWNGTAFDVEIKAKDQAEAADWAKLYQTAGVNVAQSGEMLKISGDLGKVFAAIVVDSDAMYQNKGNELQAKYGLDPRVATYGWYNSTKQVTRALDNQHNFPESLAIQSLQKKNIEPAYNYYGVESKPVGENKGVMTFMMVFYLFYTLWYGFAIYYLCQGLGITMNKSAKKAEA
nr:hypothetical protein [Desulforamulus aquiferis]